MLFSEVFCSVHYMDVASCSWVASCMWSLRVDGVLVFCVVCTGGSCWPCNCKFATTQLHLFQVVTLISGGPCNANNEIYGTSLDILAGVMEIYADA